MRGRRQHGGAKGTLKDSFKYLGFMIWKKREVEDDNTPHKGRVTKVESCHEGVVWQGGPTKTEGKIVHVAIRPTILYRSRVLGDKEGPWEENASCGDTDA